MVAMHGLQRAEAHGVEFYSRDLSTQLSGWYVKHAEGAARYFETMRSEEHTSELQSLMRISYAVFCLKKKNKTTTRPTPKSSRHTYHNEHQSDTDLIFHNH